MDKVNRWSEVDIHTGGRAVSLNCTLALRQQGAVLEACSWKEQWQQTGYGTPHPLLLWVQRKQADYKDMLEAERTEGVQWVTLRTRTHHSEVLVWRGCGVLTLWPTKGASGQRIFVGTFR